MPNLPGRGIIKSTRVNSGDDYNPEILDLLVAVAFTRPLILLLSRSPRFATGRFFGIGTATDQVAKTKAVPA